VCRGFQAPLPADSYPEGVPFNWWRLRGESATQFLLQRYNGSSWSTNFSWSSIGQMSKQDIDLNKATPKIAFTHTSGNAYSIVADGTKLTLVEGGTSLMELNSTNVIAMSDVVISKNTPKLTFDHTSGDEFSFSVSGEGGHFLLKQAAVPIMDLASAENTSMTHFKISRNQAHLTFSPDSGVDMILWSDDSRLHVSHGTEVDKVFSFDKEDGNTSHVNLNMGMTTDVSPEPTKIVFSDGGTIEFDDGGVLSQALIPRGYAAITSPGGISSSVNLTSVSFVGGHIYDLTWNTEATCGTSYPLAVATVIGSTAGYCIAEATAENVTRVRTYNSDGTVFALPFTIVIFGTK
jgi:hypothetical protein